MNAPAHESVARRARLLLIRNGYQGIEVGSDRTIFIPEQIDPPISFEATARSVRAVADVLRLPVYIDPVPGTQTMRVEFGRAVK